jgi:hypothetical protein
MAPFRVARLRIDRAVSQGKALAQLWNAIPAEDVFKIKPRVTHDGWGSIRVEEIKRISGEYPLLLGEMLYQLRSALDACIYQATIYGKPKLSEKEERSLEFPITNDPTEFPKLAKRRLWGLEQSAGCHRTVAAIPSTHRTPRPDRLQPKSLPRDTKRGCAQRPA